MGRKEVREKLGDTGSEDLRSEKVGRSATGEGRVEDSHQLGPKVRQASDMLLVAQLAKCGLDFSVALPLFSFF